MGISREGRERSDLPVLVTARMAHFVLALPDPELETVEPLPVRAPEGTFERFRPYTRYRVALARLSAGDPASAARDLSRLRASGFDTPGLLPNLAAAWLRSGEHGRARGLLEEVLGSGEARFEVLRNLGYCHAVAGDWEAARRAWERSCSLRPDHAGSLNNLAVALLELRVDLPEAARLAERAVRLASGEADRLRFEETRDRTLSLTRPRPEPSKDRERVRRSLVSETP